MFHGYVRRHGEFVEVGAVQDVTVTVAIRPHRELPGAGFRRRVVCEVTDKLVPTSRSLFDFLVTAIR